MKRLLALTLGVACLAAPAPTAQAQDEPKPGVVEEDLGDGFRLVSVNGGPGAIIDDETGLILKQVYGQPAVVDPKTGAILVQGEDGEPEVRFWGKKGGGDASGKTVDPKQLERMKAYMRRVKKYTTDLGLDERSKGAEGKKPRAKPQESFLERCLQLIGVAGEESEAILRPRLAAILEKQDQIRRSTLRLQGKGKQPRTSDLPPAVQTFLRTLRAGLEGKAPDDARLQTELAEFRAAREAQDAGLEALRKELRELLTVSQEAKLVAVGVLK